MTKWTQLHYYLSKAKTRILIFEFWVENIDWEKINDVTVVYVYTYHIIIIIIIL